MPSSSDPHPHDDALHAITTVGTWVNNADTKIGFLAGAMTALTLGVVKQRPRVEALWASDPGARGLVALALLSICAACLTLAGVWLFKALKPRLTNGEASRFAFPHLAVARLDDLVAADPADIRREAWVQAQTLSKIVLDKYQCFSTALTFGAVSGLSFVGWLLVVPTG